MVGPSAIGTCFLVLPGPGSFVLGRPLLKPPSSAQAWEGGRSPHFSIAQPLPHNTLYTCNRRGLRAWQRVEDCSSQPGGTPSGYRTRVTNASAPAPPPPHPCGTRSPLPGHPRVSVTTRAVYPTMKHKVSDVVVPSAKEYDAFVTRMSRVFISAAFFVMMSQNLLGT